MGRDEKIDYESGLLVKHRDQDGKLDFVRWKSAGLREASKDIEGYYLKVDGESETGIMEQLYLHMSAGDVADVIRGWAVSVLKEGSDWARYLLEDALHEIDQTRAQKK